MSCPRSMLTLTVVFGASTTLWQGHSVVEICGGLKRRSRVSCPWLRFVTEEAIAFFSCVCLLS